MWRKLLQYFSRGERLLWGLSVVFIVGSFCAFDRENYLTLAASLIGVTSLIFNAKGNPIGQVLMVLFSLLYGIISYTFAYYGEMITYLGMALPMAVWSAITWLRHPGSATATGHRWSSASSGTHGPRSVCERSADSLSHRRPRRSR